MPGGYLSGIFGSSPIRPMEQHMGKVLECARVLEPFTEALFKGDTTEMGKLQQRIVELENEADVLKKELRLHLPNSLFMPVARRDLLEVLSMQDNIAGTARDIAGVIVGRQMRIPEQLHEQFRSLIVRGIEAVAKADQAINELDELVETGFGPRVVELVENLLNQLDRIEHSSDLKLAEIYNELHGIERELDPIDVMFLYRIFDASGKIADQAQKVGSRLQLMLAR